MLTYAPQVHEYERKYVGTRKTTIDPAQASIEGGVGHGGGGSSRSGAAEAGCAVSASGSRGGGGSRCIGEHKSQGGSETGSARSEVYLYIDMYASIHILEGAGSRCIGEHKSQGGSETGSVRSEL
jgi:hypothetical protein